MVLKFPCSGGVTDVTTVYIEKCSASNTTSFPVTLTALDTDSTEITSSALIWAWGISSLVVATYTTSTISASLLYFSIGDPVKVTSTTPPQIRSSSLLLSWSRRSIL